MDSSSILGLIKDLAKHHINHAVQMHGKSLQLGETTLDLGHQIRQLTFKIYESLLTYHGPKEVDLMAPMSVYDRLYAVCYEKKLHNRALEADKLSDLTSALWKLDSNHDQLRNVLQFLLHLMRESGRKMPEFGSDEFHQQFRFEKGRPIHSYSFYPSEIFEGSNMDSVSQQFGGDSYDTKLFAMPPGFSSVSLPLKCNHMDTTWSQIRSGTVSNLYGALSRPLSDPWGLDTKLEIPELNEEPSPLAEKSNTFEASVTVVRLQKKIEMDVMEMCHKINGKLQAEEDEGFTESNATPSSVNSLGGIGEDSLYLWDLALTEDFLENPLPKYKTWESLKCLEPVMEKPVLTEAGPEAFDHLVFSQYEVLSIICPGTRTSFRKCNPSEVLQKSLYALLGIPSDFFLFDENTMCFSATNDITISGISPDCMHNILMEFASSGTDHARLQRLVATLSAESGSCGCVWQTFADGIRRYLYHREVVVSNMFPSKDEIKSMDKKGMLYILELLEQTAALRFQTRFLAELCLLSDAYGLNLPPGIGLLTHLYAATLHSLGNPDTFPVALSLLRRTFAPYFHFLKMWAFEGQLNDCHDEFAILVNKDVLETKDSNVWIEGFLLRSRDDPILGELLTKVLVCGKSLYLLKRCCPSHYLCRLDVAFPSLALCFLEVELQEVDAECHKYVTHVNKIVEEQKIMRIRQVEEERNAREELLKKMQVVTIRKLKKFGEKLADKKGPLISEEISPALIAADKDVGENNCVTNDNECIKQGAKANPLDLELESTKDSQDLTANDGKVINLLALGTNASTSVEVKGIKRKQDRLSILFETLEARRPVRMAAPENCETDETELPKTGILVEGSTFQVLRTRGRSTHGHSSDSTIQKLMYGSLHVKPSDEILRAEESEQAAPNIASGKETLDELSMKFFSPITIIPYELEIPAFNEFPMADIAQSILRKVDKIEDLDEVNEDFWNTLNLPVVFDRCIRIPLQAQINLVDRALLDYFVEDLKLEEHFEFVQSRFFMQDGEFSQCLCDRLFDCFSKSVRSSDLFNPLTLNSILSEAVSYSSVAKAESSDDFEKNLAFVVKPLSSVFQPNSPSVLDSLHLNYRVDFPINIVFSADVCKYYERVFSFLLQLRHCLWASTEIYHSLEMLDPSSPASVPSFYNAKQYRLLQLYRHEMHHFLRCLQEHLNLQAFQVTAIKFKADIRHALSLNDLIASHIKYLKRVTFRCLLHKNAIPLMKLVRNIFTIVLRFHSQLLAPMQNNYMHEMARFAQLQASYKIFKEYSTFLFQVVTKLVRRGYQPPLQEFLTRLDCNNWYSSHDKLTMTSEALA